MRIIFVHHGRAFLPEITGYIKFFGERGIECQVVDPQQVQSTAASVCWYFMGIKTRRHRSDFIIHEYTSASVPPIARLKNLYKRFANITPDHRLFLNPFVRSQFQFPDNIPYGYRDMGIDAEWLKQDPLNSEYNAANMNPKNKTQSEAHFVYAGEVRHRGLEKLLNILSRDEWKGRSVRIISGNYEKMKRQYASAKNIEFTGPVIHEQIPALIRHSRFALNFMPDRYPYNRQTSTKLLEYAALHVPVITTDYPWVREFQQQHGGKFFYLEKDLTNFTWENITQFHYEFPTLDQWTWEAQIKKSGIIEVLKNRFGGFR